MTTPLIPQLRADKNGKLVTRHVAEKPLPAGSALTLPAPSVPSLPQAPVKTERELKDEALDDFMAFVFPELDRESSDVKTARATASWFRLEHFDNIMKIMRGENRYVTYLGTSVSHRLRTGKGFDIAMEASVFELANALHDAGFEGAPTPTSSSESYFGRAGTLYIKDSHISDFRLHYLASTLELSDYDANLGKIEYYRQLANVGEHYEEVVRALPVLHAIMSIDTNYAVSDEMGQIVDVAVHVAKHSDDDIRRITGFVRERPTMDYYDNDLIDEMLQTEATAMGAGVL